MLSPMLYDDQSTPNPRSIKQICRLANQMQFQRKLYSPRNGYGVVVTYSEMIAQEIVQKISSTTAQGSSTEGECARFLEPFLLSMHISRCMVCLVSHYDLIHAQLETLKRGSTPGTDGFGPKSYQHS